MGGKFSRLKQALLAASTLCVASQAHAQAQPSVAAPTREEINPPTPDRPLPGKVDVDSREAFARGPCPLDQSDVRTQISEVKFTGLNGAPLAPQLAAALAGVTAPAGDQPIRVVCNVRDQANAALNRARYVATIQIPPQRIDNGVLRLEVISGRIVQTRVRGDPGPVEALVQDRIKALQALDPLNEADAERILVLANDVPGLNLRLALRPAGGAPGDLIGELTVDYERFRVLANAQNYNSKALGRETAYVRGEINGLTGMGDVTYVALSSTLDFEEQWIAQVGHSMLLTGDGVSLNLRGSYAESRPDLEQLSLLTRSWIGGIDVGIPLVRSLRKNVSANVGYEHLDQRTVVDGPNGTSPLNLDKVRAVFARVNGSMREPRFDRADTYFIGGYVELRKDLDIFNATKTGVLENGYAPSRFEGSATATIARAELDTSLALGPIFEFAGDYRAQWTDEPLLNFDEFSIGNLTVGRGYDPGANTGDRAWGASWELRANVPVGRAKAQVYGFFDNVELWNLDQNSTEAHRVLQSVGGGVRVSLPGLLVLDVGYAHPMDPPLLIGNKIEKAPDRVLVSLTARLVPFGITR